MSEPLARPFGCLSFADRSSSAEELMAPHEATTTSPENSSRVPFWRTITLLTWRPSELVSSRSTSASVISVTFGYWSAGSTPSTCASDFAYKRHGKPSQVEQRMHLLLRDFSSSITPKGV